MPDTIGYTPAKLANGAASAKQGLTHRGGQTHFKRLTDATTPTRTDEAIREEFLRDERIWAFLMQFRAEPVSGLNIAVNGGVYRKADGTDVTFAANNSYAIADAQTDRKVWIDVAGNALAQGAAWPADKTTFVPICEVDTAAGAVVSQSIRDRTNLVRLAIPGTSSSPTGTTAIAFTIDDDNAGAGATTQVRFNRGSTDAEDAAVEWDETNDRFNCRAQHSTATLAPLNASALKVAGTDVIAADGDLEAASIATDQLYEFGPNGSTPAGLKLAPSGVTGPPSSGAHAKGEKDVDSTGIERICITAGTPGAWVRVGDQNSLVRQVSIPDASGASPRTVSIQIKDNQGANVSEATYLQVGVYQDADGAANATNATIAVGGTGTLVRTITTNKVLIVKTNSSGVVDLTITDGTLETVYVLAAPAPRSRLLDCSDIGTVVIS